LPSDRLADHTMRGRATGDSTRRLDAIATEVLVAQCLHRALDVVGHRRRVRRHAAHELFEVIVERKLELRTQRAVTAPLLHLGVQFRDETIDVGRGFGRAGGRSIVSSGHAGNVPEAAAYAVAATRSSNAS
jgi:hypothetical protein